MAKPPKAPDKPRTVGRMHWPDFTGEQAEKKILLAILEGIDDIKNALQRKSDTSYIVFSVTSGGKTQTLTLLPGKVNRMSLTNLTLGHNAVFSWTQLDARGNPMITPVAADAPPTYSNTNPEVETITPAGDGLSAQGATLALGTDTVTSVGSFGGVSFTVSADIEVDDVPQVLTSARLDVAVV